MIEQPEFQELKRELVELTGLAYYNKQEKLLAKRVGKRLASTQLELAQYRRLLLDSTVELANLIQEVTLGESYFLRYPDQTTALEQVLLPVLLERKRSRRELRIWSAGCSTGEEPYSLLFLLKDRFESQLAGWEVEILATDINELYLSRAEEAHFRDWSLRSVSEQTRERWFVPSGKGWQVRPRYRDWLRFERHNLVRDPFPTLEGGFDLILCRNVLMYFRPEVARRVCECLAECLTPEGTLLLGHSDFLPNHSPKLEAHRGLDVNGFVLRGSQPEVLTPVAKPVPPPPIQPSQLRLPSFPSPPSSGGLLEIEERLEDSDYDGAEQLCRVALEERPLEAVLHLHLAISLFGQSRAGEAREAIEKSLFLDHRSLQAHFYSAVFYEAAGQESEAQRCYRNVLGLMRGNGSQCELEDVVKNRLRGIKAR